MKKFAKALCLIISLSMLLSCFIVIPAQAVIENVYVNEDFEDMTVGKVPTGDGWKIENTDSTSYVKIAETDIFPNRAMSIVHKYSGVKPVTATHNFEASSNVKLSFDFNYESISTQNGRGGMVLAFFNADKSVRAHGIYICKLDETVADDTQAKVGYYNGSAYVDIAGAVLDKGEWYHFDIEIDVESDASYMNITVSQNGNVISSGSSLKCWRHDAISKVLFGNASNDANDSHFIDNVSLTAGNHMFNDSFETLDYGTAPDTDNWVVDVDGQPATRSDVCIKVEKAPDVKKITKTPNKALNLYHDDSSTGYIARYTFDSVSTLKASFDLKYDGMDTRDARFNNNGVMVNFASSDGATRAIGLFINSTVSGDDSEAKVTYYNGSAFPRIGTETLKKGEWYHFELDITVGSGNTSMNITVTHNGQSVISASGLTCSKRAEIGRLDFASPTSNQDQISWIDNVKLTSGDKTVIDEDFEDETVGAIPTWVSFWKGSPSAAASNTATCYVKVLDCPIVNTEYNKVLNIVDASGAGPVRALQSIGMVETATVELDFMLNTADTFEGCAFILHNSKSTESMYTNQNKIIISTVPNKTDGVYNGTCTIQYFNHSEWKYYPVKTDIIPNKWYNIKIGITADNEFAKLYLDGELISDTVATKSNITGFDEFVIQSGSAGGKGENFFVDNLKITTPLTYAPFVDTYESSLGELYTVKGDGNAEVKNGELVLDGGVKVQRAFGATKSAEFTATVKTDTPEGFSLALMSGGTKVMALEADANGKLFYHRGNVLIPLNERVLIEKGRETQISIDLAPDRNCDYANVRVDGQIVGIMLLDIAFETVDSIQISTRGGAVAVTKLESNYSAGAITAPERKEADPITYLPEVIDAEILYLENDKAPTQSTLAPCSESSIVLETQYSSVGVDLGNKQKINAIRFTTSSADEIKLNHNGFVIYQSDDNANWTKLNGYTYNHLEENGKWVCVFEFSGVETRYVKINYTHSSSTGVTVENPAVNIRAERRIPRQWKMAGDFMSATDGGYPETARLTRIYADSAVTLDAGNSIGINFGLISPVEAVEIAANGLSSLTANDFAVYVSNDNFEYSLVENVVLSRDTENGKDVLRLTFDSIECAYVKLYAKEGVEITLDSAYNDFRTYSSVEASSYRKSGMWLGTGRGGEGDYYTLPDGTMIMVYDGFPAENSDFSDVDIVARMSLDGGVTWSDPWIMLDKPVNAVNTGLPRFVWLEDGGLGVIYFVKTEGDICNLYFRRSYDYGRNWEAPILITEMYDWNYSVVSSGNYVLRLTTGRIVIAATVSDYLNDVWGSVHQRAFIWYSDDDGTTWHRSDGMVTLPTCADEPSVAELANGNLIMSIRTRQQGKVFESISTDEGNTWSQPVAVENVDTPSSTNVLVTIPATGDLLLIWNNEKFNAANNGGNGLRDPLTTAVSADNGLTFKNYKNVIEARVSWPLMDFYGRRAFMQTSNGIKVCDVEEFYYSTSGVRTVADLPKAATPTASYKDGWLTDVSATMQYSLDGGATWKFCGGTEVQIGDAESIMVKDISTHEYAPSDIQTVK